MSIIQEIEGTLSAEKLVQGEPCWQPHADGNMASYTWSAPLSIDGIIINCELRIEAFPKRAEFTILLIYEYDGKKGCIFRLEYNNNDKHLNPLGTVPLKVNGPHYHSWERNRTYFQNKSHLVSKKTLPVADPLPPEVRSFRQALRFFLNCVNIVVPSQVFPDYPEVRSLL